MSVRLLKQPHVNGFPIGRARRRLRETVAGSRLKPQRPQSGLMTGPRLFLFQPPAVHMVFPSAEQGGGSVKPLQAPG
ncbi:MAG: hypothetical protein E7323_12040 [Clostridiales bacterium]|nr:hypothetical protein [Clostridiales bacterium]